jgi:hypothetical protein
MKRARAELPIYHDSSEPVSLGCKPCREIEVCGGLQTAEGLHNCLNFCVCTDLSRCPYICPRKLEHFLNREREIGGFTLKNMAPAPALRFPSLPSVIPHIYGRTRRNKKLSPAAISIPLGKLFYRKTGLPKYLSKAEVADAFGFDPSTALIINGVSEDQPIEDYWLHRKATRLADCFASLEPALITVPNYSVFTNVPRWDSLDSIKRIAICWSEFMMAGIPASLHLNARTDVDWMRWIEFIGEHPELRSVTFEFATGAAHKDRAAYHVEKLISLAGAVAQDLQLLVRGGLRYLRQFDAAFAECVFIDTGSYVKTIKRRKLDWIPGGKKHWRSAKTAKEEPLDDLLAHNIQRNAAMTAFVRSSRAEIEVHKAPFAETAREPKFVDPRQILLPWRQLDRRSSTQTLRLPETVRESFTERRLNARSAST